MCDTVSPVAVCDFAGGWSKILGYSLPIFFAKHPKNGYPKVYPNFYKDDDQSHILILACVPHYETLYMYL